VLAELEAALVDVIKASALGKCLRMIGTLPHEPEKDVLRRWATDAPAIYVVPCDGEVNTKELLTPFVLVLVAKNASGHEQARRGDLNTIGLYAMLEHSISVLHRATVAGVRIQCSQYSFLQDEELTKNGLYAITLLITASGDVPALSADGLMIAKLYSEWRIVADNEQPSKPLCAAYIDTKGQNNEPKASDSDAC
jgi:phage gp37-like protein